MYEDIWYKNINLYIHKKIIYLIPQTVILEKYFQPWSENILLYKNVRWHLALSVLVVFWYMGLNS